MLRDSCLSPKLEQLQVLPVGLLLGEKEFLFPVHNPAADPGKWVPAPRLPLEYPQSRRLGMAGGNSNRAVRRCLPLSRCPKVWPRNPVQGIP